jgi:FkbM family methyltransferase
MRSTDARYGKIWYYGKDEYVGRSLHNYGEFSGEECEIIHSLAVPNKLCLDIGANIGVMAQMLESYGFECVSFEPQPEIHKLLSLNSKGRCFNAALGSVEGTAKMPRLRYGDKHNYGGMSLNTKSALGSYDVPVYALDSYNFQNVGFMKIDVEGWEEEVLKGALDTIARCRPVMYIEDDRVEKSKSLRKFITETLNYSIEQSSPPLFRPNNFRNNPVNIWDREYVSHNIICRPN